MIVFVGLCPSKDNLDPKIPFLGSRSGRVLKSWIFNMGVSRSEYCLRNVSNNLACKKPLPSEIMSLKTYLESILKGLGRVQVVSLGVEATLACRRCGIEPFMLPHPSGRNRQLNDPDFVAKKLLECRRWLDAA